MKKKWIVAGITAALASLLVAGAVWAAPIAQGTVLGGVVAEVVAPGTTVKEGDVLLKVNTIGGPMVAARATVSGVVETVSVSKGASVEVGQHIAVINSK